MLHALRLFLPFAAGYFLSFLLRNTNAIIAPDLTRELGFSAADLGLLTSAYLLTFASFQLPLGVLLDRYGPRRVEAALLLAAACGSAWFAVGEGLAELAAARALIGLGVCACLMGSFKAFALWYPPERLAALNSAVMVAGGLGALTATTPLVHAVEAFGWRGLFGGFTVLTTLAALAVFSTPEKRSTARVGTFGEQVQALRAIAGSRVFWNYAPMAAAGFGGFIALQGLWAVPWIMEVNGATRETAAFHMLLATSAMVCGWLGTAVFVEPLSRRGIAPARLMAFAHAACLGIMLLLWLDAGDSRILWFALGALFAVGHIVFAEITQRFPVALSGRVNTMLNLCIFMGAFAVQSGYGLVLGAAVSGGSTPAEAQRIAFGTLAALQAAGFGWFVLNTLRVRPPLDIAAEATPPEPSRPS